jgi:hypothetical protein
MDKPETEDVASAARLVGMQPSRFPPYVLAIVLTATLLLFLAGLAAAKMTSQGTHPIAPSAPFLPQSR